MASYDRSSSEEVTPPVGRSWLGRIFILVVVALFLGWGGVRVTAALKIKRALADERVAVAAEAAKNVGPKLTEVVHGMAETYVPVIPIDGTLQPAHDADLGFKVSGRLTSVRVRIGDCVGAGASLGSLDSAEAIAQVQAAEAQVRAAEAQLALARDAEKRTGALVGNGAGSTASKVQADQQALLAAAQADGSKAQLSLAQVNLRNHTLSAPFAGCLTKVPSGTGIIVNPGAPLFHLQDYTSLKLAGTLGEGDAQLVTTGASIALSSEAGPMHGKIVSVLSSVDAQTRRVPFEAEIKNPKLHLRSGAFVRAEVVGLPAVPVLRLPGSTLRPGSQDELVLVKDGKADIRRVVFSATRDGSLVVMKGLEPTDEVMLSPVSETKPGDALVVAAATKARK